MNTSRFPATKELKPIGNHQLVRDALAILMFGLYWWGIHSLLVFNVPDLDSYGLLFSLPLAWVSVRLNQAWAAIGYLALFFLSLRLSEGTWNGIQLIVSASAAVVLFYWRMSFESLLDRWTPIVAQVPSVSQPQWLPFWNQEILKFFKSLGLCFAVTLAASIILYNSPVGAQAADWIDWSVENRDVLGPGATLIVVLIGIAIFLNAWSWRSMTAMQAKLHQRSHRISWQYADLSRVARLKKKQIEKKSQIERKKA